jgi:hypothetical protein
MAVGAAFPPPDIGDPLGAAPGHPATVIIP